MTLEEMQKVARILSTADSGCSVCIGNLIEETHKAFPEFILTMTDSTWRRPLFDYDPGADEWETFAEINVAKAPAPESA